MATPYDQQYPPDPYANSGSMAPTRPPTWREQLAQLLMGDNASPERRQFVGGLVGSTGLPGSEQFGVADLTPAAIPLGLNEREVARQAGDRGGELASTLAAVPLVGKEASLAARAAQRLARGAEGAAAPAERAAVQFIEPKGTPSYRTVQADVGKIDQSAAKDADMYVGPGGEGGIKGRYGRFEDFLQTGQPVEMPMATVGPSGEATFSNGRHRFAVLRDQGHETIPMRVPEDAADAFQAKFGAQPAAPAPAAPAPARAFGGGEVPTIPDDVRALYSQGVSDVPLQGTGRISQRYPTELGAGGWEGKENPLTQNLLINRSVLERDPKKLEQASAALGSYPNATAAMQEMNPAERVSAMQDQMKANLLALHDLTPADIRARAGRWYWGANTLAQKAAERTGVPVEAAAGTFAALSPQMDWLKNVYLGNTVLDTLARNPKMTPDMMANGLSMTAKDKQGTIRKVFDQDMVRSMQGKSLQDMPDAAHKAQFIRLWDETHGARQYRDVTPEGDFGELINTKTGTPKKPGWGSMREIEKAVKSAESGGDMATISEQMGGAHKVRNFYNNIVAPDTPAAIGDITADTHQIAAALMRPLSGTSLEVAQGLGTGKGAPQSAVSGLSGLYPLYADATRQAAAERGIAVPSMQSIPWETIRGLYDPQFKKTGGPVTEAIWKAHGRGELTLPQAQQQLIEAAGGYRPPSWWGGR